jgi:hypothetical protein
MSMNPRLSKTLYTVGARDSPKILLKIRIFLAGSALCSRIVPITEVRAIKEKIIIANFTDTKSPQILSMMVFFSSDNIKTPLNMKP